MAAAASVLLKIGGDDSAFAKVIGRAQSRLTAFGKGIQSFGGKISGIGKSVSALTGIAAAPFAGAIAGFASAGDAADKLSQKLGLSTETLSEYQFALGQSGTDVSVFTNAIKSMSNVIAKQSGEASKMAESIGLSLEDLAGLSPEHAFERIADALNNTTDDVTKMAAAQALLGGSGTKLIPLLGSFRELRQEARDLNAVMTTEQSTMAALMVDSFGRVTATFKALSNSIATAFAPTITDIANRIAGITSTVIKWVQQNQSFILSIGKGIAIIGALGAGLVALGSAVSLIGVGVGGLASLFGVVATVAGAVLSPIGLLVGALAGGAYYFLAFTDAGKSLISFFQGEFLNLYNIVKPIIDSVVSAFRMGDMTMAFSIAMAALKVPALQAWGYIKGIFNDGVFYIMSLWDSLVFGLLKAWTVISDGTLSFNFLKIGILSVGKYVSDTFLSIVSGIVDMFGWMVKKVAGALYALNIISDKTLVGVNSTIRDVSKSVSTLRDDNNKYYDGQIAAANNKIDKSEDGRQLAALNEAQDASIASRAQANIDSASESDRAIAQAQAELADLMRQQADAAAAYKPPEPGQAPTAVQKAASIKPAEITKSISDKVDVGSTASFNSRVASMLANNVKSKIEQEQLDALKQIAENTSDLEGVGMLAGGSA